MEKDFYRELPGFVCDVLEQFIDKYGKEIWFQDAWEDYRKHVKTTSMDEVRMPAYVFSKYISEMEDK